MTRSPLAVVIALVGLTTLLAGCSSGSEAGDGSATTTPTTASPEVSVSTTADSAEVSAPTTPDEAVDYVVGLINGAPLTEAQFEQNFDADFIAAIEFAEFSLLVEQLAAEGPWERLGDRGVTAANATYEITAPSGDILLVDVAVAATGGIAGLFFSPDRVFEAPASVEEAVARLEALGELRLAVMDTSNGACAPVVDEGLNEVMPLGSAFKLYVLGAVVVGVDSGEISWDSPVVIRDELDSLPSGTTQDVEPGTELTVRELAEAMISISDNTATDHLIDLVGRDAVEAILEPMGNDALDRNHPFLTTRELFILKFGDPKLVERYVLADEAERRAILAGVVAAAPLPDLSAFDPATPVLVEEVEWFASPRSICDAMTWLAADPVAIEILSINPGVPGPDGQWNTIAFKGGSEPGLLAVAWWSSTDDGRAFVTAGSVVSSSGPVDEFEAVNLLAFIRDTGPTLE